MKRKIFTTIMIFAFSMALVGCGNEDASTESSKKNVATEDVKSDNEREDVEVESETKFEAIFDYSGTKESDSIHIELFGRDHGVLEEDDNFYYSVYENGVYCYYKKGLGDTVKYPAEYKGKPVRAVGLDYTIRGEYNSGDVDFSEVKKVELPYTVWIIGAEAFKDYKNLTDINIPEYLVSADHGCFQNCISLKELHFPETMQYFSTNLFKGCDNLKAVYVKGDNYKKSNMVFSGSPIEDFTKE